MDAEMIEGFVLTLKEKPLQGITISRYLENLRYGLRYLYIKDGKEYSEQEHYINVGRLGEQCRRQVVSSTACRSWQALQAQQKWAEW